MGAAADVVGCRVCGSTRLRPLARARDRLIGGRERRWVVAWCAACRCGTTQVAPDGGYWRDAYPEEYFRDVLKVGTDLDRADQLRHVEAAGHVAGSRVLEIGCSSGDLLCLLRDRGATVAGVEPGDVSRGIARSRGLDVVATLAEVRGGPFDIVVLFDVLEHLPSPVSTLQWVSTKLSLSGRVVIGVPNIESLEFRLLKGRWFALELPRHLTHFSPTGMERLAATAGLAVRRLHYPRISFLEKSFVDPRLKDGWLAQGGLLARILGVGCGIVEQVLFRLGNRPWCVAVLVRA